MQQAVPMLLLLVALAGGACTGGVYVNYPTQPDTTCMTCTDDVSNEPDPDATRAPR